MLALENCKTSTPTGQDEAWQPTFYMGSATEQAIVRDYGRERMTCTDPKFSEVVCMFERDFMTMYRGCVDSEATTIENLLGRD